MRIFTMICILFFLPTGVSADIYRCVTAEGHVIFSDTPCGANAEALETDEAAPEKAPDEAPVPEAAPPPKRTGERATAPEPAQMKPVRSRAEAGQLISETLHDYRELEATRTKLTAAGADLRRRVEEAGRVARQYEGSAEASRYQERWQVLKSELEQVEAPLRKRMEDIENRARRRDSALSGVMRTYQLAPGGEFDGIVPATVSATSHKAFIAFDWHDAAGKRTAWAHLRLRDKPRIPPGLARLEDRYYISSQTDRSLWVWAGHFHVSFVMERPEWQSSDRLRRALPLFVDLEGLERIEIKGR